jgi:hypothetical protein
MVIIRKSWPAILTSTVLAAITVTTLPAAAATTTLGTSPTTVTLITGDRVTVSAQGLALRPATPGTTFQTYQDATGDHFVIPSVAEPYLGRQLDPALFDVSALIRDGVGTTGRTPVQLTFATTPVAPAGVTITSAAGNTASGYVAAAAGTTFTAALRQQIGADVAAGNPAGTAPLFGGLTGLSLAAAGPSATAQPHFPLHILQLNGTDTSGKPVGFALAFLLNTDEVTRAQEVVPLVNGIARVAVPAGNYTAFGLFTDFDTSGNAIASRTVTLADFAVASAGTTTESLDERTANSQIRVTTPRPANQDLLVTSFSRTDAAGHRFTLSDIGFGTIPTFVNAQPAVTVGTLRYTVQWGGQPTPGPTSPYRFDVAFGADDIPADESFVVKANQIATVHQHFSADPAGNGGALLNGAIDPKAGSALSVSSADAQPMPGDQTQYLGTADGGTWTQAVFTNSLMAAFADNRTVVPGRTYAIDWLHGPLAAGFGQHSGPSFCAVCVAGGTLVLAFNPSDDSEASQSGFAFVATNHFTLSQDGKVIADAPGATGALVSNIPAAPSTFRAVLDSDLTGVTGFSQSTRTHTDLTVRYRPDNNPALPAPDTCAGQSATTPCAILPALDLNYHLATDETNTSHQRIQVLGLRVGHASFDGIGSRSRITSADVSVSFDGGTTWQPANVFGANGFYVATWRNPESPASPMLKVTAADANGDSIAQTITNAYTVGGER